MKRSRSRVWRTLSPMMRLYFAGVSGGDAARAQAICEVILAERPVRQVARGAGIRESTLRMAAASARRTLGRSMRAAGLRRGDVMFKHSRVEADL